MKHLGRITERVRDMVPSGILNMKAALLYIRLTSLPFALSE